MGDSAALRFSQAERDQRWQRVRALMAQDDIDVIVAPPHTGHHDHFSAYTRDLAGIGGFSFEVGVVFPLEGQVTALTVPDVAPSKWQAQQDWVTDIRGTGRAFGDGIIARLKELRLKKPRIGLAGLSGVPRFADGIVPHLFYTKLAAEFPDATIVDCTTLLDRARYVKSEEEIAFLRRSVEMAEAAIDVLRKVTRPGATEASVYAAALGAMIERGSEIPAMIMWQAGPPDDFVSAGPPTLRRFEAGDFLRVEIEGRCGGYCGQVTQMMVLGTLPPPYRDMWSLQQDAVQLCCAEIRPGLTLGELARRTEALAHNTPYRIRFLMHGRGLGDDAPMYVFSASDEVKRWPLEANASFIVKPVVSREGMADVVWGDSIVVTPQGTERLGTLKPEFMTLA